MCFLPIYSGRQARERITRGHTGFLIHLLSAVLALNFLARRIQPFLSLVDREVDFCVLPTNSSFSTCWAIFIFIFIFFVRKNLSYRDSKPVVVVVVVSHIQRIGCQPEKTTLHGGQSRSWSAEQGKANKRKSLAAYPPPPHPPHCSFGENK